MSDALAETVREECTPAAWTRGLHLARRGAVARLPAGGYRVEDGSALATPEVTLLPAEDDWRCTCGGKEDPCAHVAAAVIAVARAERAGRELPLHDASRAPRVRYLLSRAAEGLAFDRLLVRGDETYPLRVRLLEGGGGGARALGLEPRREDIEVEVALGGRLRGRVERAAMPALLAALARCADVRLDGAPIRVSGDPVRVVARVRDRGEGFVIVAEDEVAVEERFPNGAVIAGGVVRPAGEAPLPPEELRALRAGRPVEAGAARWLVGEVLPRLREKIEVRVETARLPQSADHPPRLVLETSGEGESLEVRAVLLYGEPPIARVDRGRLTLLGDAVPLRREEEERRLLRRAATLLGGPGPSGIWRGRGEEAIALAERVTRARLPVRGKAHRRFRTAGPLRPRVEIRERGFDLRFETDDGATADPERVLAAFAAGRTLVPLAGGAGWAPLPDDWLAKHGERVAALLAARDARGNLPTWRRPELGDLCDALEMPRPPALERLRPLADGFRGLPRAPLPPDLTADLRAYQRLGVDWLVFCREAGLGALLADDMGLGKTLQALCAIAPPALVVAPTSVLPSWADEIRRFRPALSLDVYHGPRRALGSADITLTTYAILRRDAGRLQARRFRTVVLDEAQAIKNPESQVARAAYGLQADFRVALTGTPVENRLDELWSQMHFLNPGLLGGRGDFEARLATPVAAGNPAAVAELRRRIRPVLLRRTKAEVTPELPPRTEVVRYCELDEEERATYDAVRAATREEVVRALETGGGVMAALEALLRLRQAACHRALLPGQAAAGSSKLSLLVELLETPLAEGHRALVFSQWTGLLDLVEPVLRAQGIDFCRLDGSTRDRGAVVSRFQAPDGPPVMLVSLKAGGVGLTLTAADHVFILDPWWNPAAEDQAADRAHRIGQERPVLIQRLVARDTVEERILALQAHKRALADAALAGGGGAARLSRDDLLALLTDGGEAPAP